MQFPPVWPEFAEELLLGGHHSGLFGPADNFVRRDYAQLPANVPCRDESCSGFIPLDPENVKADTGPRLLMNAIFDGRGTVRDGEDSEPFDDSMLITLR